MKLIRTFTEEINIQFLLDLPQNYTLKNNWPLVIFLHGYEERGEDLDLVKKHGLPRLVEEGQQFPFLLKYLCLLLLSQANGKELPFFKAVNLIVSSNIFFGRSLLFE